MKTFFSGSMQEILIMWLGFFKECMVYLMFLGINLLSLSATSLLYQLKFDLLPSSVLQFHSYHNRNSWQIFCVHLNCNFKELFRFTKVDCFTVTTVNFINNIVFIFCSYSIFRFTKEFMQSVFSVGSWPCFVRSEFML